MIYLVEFYELFKILVTENREASVVELCKAVNIKELS